MDYYVSVARLPGRSGICRPAGSTLSGALSLASREALFFMGADGVSVEITRRADSCRGENARPCSKRCKTCRGAGMVYDVVSYTFVPPSNVSIARDGETIFQAREATT